MEKKPLRVLVVEDSTQDAELLLRELFRLGYSPVSERVETAAEMANALDEKEWDVVLSDFILPGFGGLEALKLLHDKGLDLPFIVVSGQIGEDVAVGAMRAGAHDYIMKGNFKRLGPAIERELAEAENRKMRRQAEEDLKRSAADLRALAQRLLQVQEEERRNLARELHDEIGQQLTLLKLLQDKAKGALGEQAPEELADACEMTAKLTDQVRSMSLRLRPSTLDELGLGPTLQAHIQDFTEKTDIRVDFKHSGLDGEFSPDIRTCAYRTVQEALTNVLRYSMASRVDVKVEVDGETIDIQVRDNGVGFNPTTVSTSSSGLRGIRERARYLGGTFDLESAAGQGTRITVRLPLGKCL